MKTDRLQAFFWRIRSNKMFEGFVIVIIITSALLIGAKTYDISPLMSQIITIADLAITAFFLSELVIRFLGEEKKARFFTQGWNIFDTIIVVASLVPIENSEMALLGRLIRVFRVLRMVSIVPEMRLLLDSLLKALPQLGYVVALMFIIFYIYGAVGSLFFAQINPALWGDISISMLTLFRVMTFEDWTDVMYETMAVYPLSWAFYLSFIFFTAFAFLNMVIGIVVNTLHEESDRIKLEQQGRSAISLHEIYDELKLLREEVKSQRVT
jgi:voltage-gated sodium channel